MDKNNKKDDFFSINLNDLKGFDLPGSSPAIDYRRYWEHLLKKKWWILAIATVIAVGFIIGFNYYQPTPKYTSTAIIHFNRSEKQNLIDDFDNTSLAARLSILKTKNFLIKVVDSLHLNFQLDFPDRFRNEVFEEIAIDGQARHGQYQIVQEDRQFSVYHLESEDNPESRQIFTGALTNDAITAFAAGGFRLTFKNAILRESNEIIFSHFEEKEAIEILRANLLPQFIDRFATIFHLSYEDRSPDMAALIANTIAGLFIKQLEAYSKLQAGSMFATLEDELSSARRELAGSKDALERFERANPDIKVNRGNQKNLDKLETIRNELDEIDRDIKYLKSLQDKKSRLTGFEDITFVYQEIISELRAKKLSGIYVFQQQLTTLSQTRQRLLDRRTSPQSYELRNVTEQIEALQQQVDQRVERYLVELDERKSRQQDKLHATKKSTSRFPQKELQHDELRKTLEIKQNIVQNILKKYNEAKIANEVQFTNAILIGEAEPPKLESELIYKAKIIAGGIASGFFLSIAIFLMGAYFDRTIKSAKDIQENLALPVLVTIPVVQGEKYLHKNGNADSNGHLSPGEGKLITRNYTASIENEVFRQLRISLTPMDPKSRNTIVITSLNPNEGKSFVSANLAITFSQQKRLTLLIDGDLRKGTQYESFERKKEPGLTDFLLSNCPISGKYISKILQKTTIPNLFLISTGKGVPNPAELLGGPRMEQLYRFLAHNFATIVIDTPPFGRVPDVFAIKRFIKQVLLVTRYEKTNLNHLKEKIDGFAMNNMAIQGVVVNASAVEYKKYKHSYYDYYNY